MCVYQKSLLGSTERIVQEIDSVEYGLTDIQEYYANTGLKGKKKQIPGDAGVYVMMCPRCGW